MSCGRAGGVVLAAGLSTRMPGQSKLLRSLRESSVIEAVVGAALAAGLEPVVVVLGHEADRIAKRLRSYPVQLVRNEAHRSGRASSLSAGLRALEADDEVGAAVVLLGDEPGVRPAAIAAVIDAWKAGQGSLIRSRYRDRPGHPVLLERHLFSLASGLRGEEGAWGALASRTRAVEIPAEGDAPVDVDRPRDLTLARRRAE